MNFSINTTKYRDYPECWQWSVVRKESREVIAAGWNIGTKEGARRIAKAVRLTLIQESKEVVKLQESPKPIR